MRTRRLTVVAVAMTLFLTPLVATPAAAAGATGSGNLSTKDDAELLPALPPSKAPATSVAAESAPSGSCAGKVQSLAAVAKARGDEIVPCMEQSAPGGPKKLVRPEARVSALVPLPDWCYDHQYEGWWQQRYGTCRIHEWVLVVFNASTFEITGEMYLTEVSYAYTSWFRLNWNLQTQWSSTGGWGNVSGAVMKGYAQCSIYCTVQQLIFPDQSIDPFSLSTVDGEGGYNSVIQTIDEIRDAVGAISVYVTVPTAPPSNTVSIEPPLIRCDASFGGLAGCIVKGHTPIMQYSLTGKYAQLARHIRDAQNSGLRGAYPSGPPLNHTTDTGIHAANRLVSCGDAPTIAGLSCDEYPPASTYQGAARQPNPSVSGRTFPWCNNTLPYPHTTGPVGWSRCMINAQHNSEGGGALSTFYLTNRVIDNDAFFIWVTP